MHTLKSKTARFIAKNSKFLKLFLPKRKIDYKISSYILKIATFAQRKCGSSAWIMPKLCEYIYI